MNYSTKKSLVRKFYEEEVGKFYQGGDFFSNFFPDCRIGRLQFLGGCSEVLESVEIERPPQDP